MKTQKNFLYALELMLRIYPLQFAFRLLSNGISAALSFFSNAYLLRFVVNGLQEKMPIWHILQYVFLMLALRVLFGTLREVCSNRILPIADRKSAVKLNRKIYRRSLEIDYASYENPRAYELYNRAVTNGCTAAHSAMDSVLTAVTSAVELSLNGWLLFTIDPVLIVFAAVPLFMNLLLPRFEKMSYDYSMSEMEINRKKDYTRRTFYQAEYAKEMRLTNIHRVMYRRFEDAIREYVALLRDKGLKSALASLSYSFVINIAVTFGAEIYALFCTLKSGTMMFGDCLVILNSVGNFASPASCIGDVVSSYHEAALNIRDYRRFMTEEPKVKPNPDGTVPTYGDIEMRDVSFRYDGASSDALRHMTLQIKQGEHIAIVGRNGSGKTTLVKLLLRLYDPDSGSILMDGRDIRECRLREYRRLFGVVFQDYRQLSVTVAENVLGRPFLPEDEETVTESLKKVGLYEMIQGLPNGIHTVVTREFDPNGLVLSGGQSQKLALAAVYAKNADIAVLDEPSSALDPLAEDELFRKLAEVCAGKTVITISHRLSSTISADRIFYMENGRITETGTHSQLMRKNAKYAELFRVQAQNYTDCYDREETDEEA